MDSAVFTSVSKDGLLPLASLRLLVPPVQLMTASMWQVLKTRDVTNYWKVAEFVSFITDMVPELLMYKHRAQLNLGLRARYILELCQNEFVEAAFISSHLDKIKSQHPSKMEQMEEEEEAADHFLELIQTLLNDPDEREEFFLEAFPVVYGAQYDSDLQTLFWEFLCRLAQLLPVPDLEQTVLWLGGKHSGLEDCVHSLSEPTNLKNLLQHHQHHGHLEQHVPPSSMGDSILSSLAVEPPSRAAKTEQLGQSESPQGTSMDTHTVSFVDDVVMEIITATDYPEVELGASTEIEVVVVGESPYEGEDGAEAETQAVLSEETAKEQKAEATQEKAECTSIDVIHSEANDDVSASSQLGISVSAHDCPDCEKKFKFASSLVAHRVIHTGERPHQCHDCGRRFSFRQSLDRHRRTHKSGRDYTCAVCGESFSSLSARTEHKQMHMEDGVYACQLCSRKFNWELALARHLRNHADDCDDNKKAGREVDARDCVREAPIKRPAQLDENCDPGSSGRPSPELRSLASDPDKDVSPVVQVRTSGRTRKPTMKSQVITFQKLMTAKRRKELAKALKPLPFTRAEHSYGSSVVSSNGSNEHSVAHGSQAFSFHHVEAEQVDGVHSAPTQEHEQGGRFSCSVCEKSFKFQSLLKAHQRTHTGEQPFSCSQCGRCFSFKQSLERHKETHKSGRRYECLICGEFFKSPVARREHQSSHMENGEYLCSACGRAFAWKSALVRHVKTHCEDGGKAQRLHQCSRCGLGFSCASYLSRHLQTHQEEREHTCSCGKSFAYRAALTAHQRIHQKERPHACAQCGKGFLYKGGLLSHMKIHSEEKPFMCSYCGKSFKRERNMKKHERYHTREDVFSCSQCDKSFVYKATLVRHELTHSGERPYLCSDCGKGFFSHAELLKHERFHTGHKPFHCPHCGKKFTQSCYLTIHLRYHTGARPYSCGECDKSFLSANRLKRHQRTHSGERPYLCVECGKGFRQSYNLKMHQRTHTAK